MGGDILAPGHMFICQQKWPINTALTLLKHACIRKKLYTCMTEDPRSKFFTTLKTENSYILVEYHL